MTLDTQIAALTQSTNDMLTAVNTRKSTFDSSIAAASTQAGAAAGSAAQALAIYGSTAAVSAAVAQAQNQASVAAGYAASAGSAIQQDISGVTAAALHRSPNAVVAMVVNDTTKDSDGGAWTEKCQHMSWYNEPLNGKWLGACATEAAARAVSGATTGDYFQASYDGKFYKLNAGSGTTEVFRGNKAKFPKIVGIVAESAFLTIYDLTDPGRPMWMRFVNTGAMGTGSISSLAAINGTIYVGGASGLAEIDFTHDILRFRNASGVTAQQYLATRATSARLTASGSPIVNTAVNSVAATVLPDAPVDPVSGLQVPTIACLAGETKVLMENGTTKRIDEIVTGDFVKTLEGSSRVLSFFDQGIKQTIEVVFDNGTTLICTSDHKIRTSVGWVEAGALTDKHDVVGI